MGELGRDWLRGVGVTVPVTKPVTWGGVGRTTFHRLVNVLPHAPPPRSERVSRTHATGTTLKAGGDDPAGHDMLPLPRECTVVQ